MPRPPQIHSCNIFAFLLDEEVVEIIEAEYHADFAHWYQRPDGLKRVDYSIGQALRYCPFCGEKLGKPPTMVDFMIEAQQSEV